MALPDHELITLLADLESDRVERKESAANSDQLSVAICGFANDMPGYGEPGVLFVGVSDKGAVLGQPITDKLLLRLADLRDQGTILPPPTMTVRKLRVDGGEVAVVEVQPLGARNAVMHRSYEHTASVVRITWYSDRVEVTSPGGPYGIVSAGNFGRPGITDYRNPALADLLRGLGYVQRFGMGLPSTHRALKANGNPSPEFEVMESHISVTIRRRL